MTLKLFGMYLLGLVLIICGGLFAKYVDATSGALIGGAGAWWIGKVQAPLQSAHIERQKAAGVIPDRVQT